MTHASVPARARAAVGHTTAARGSTSQAAPWLKALARAGIGARGVIYVLLAYLALDIALHGSAGVTASSQGALQEVAKQPGGSALLVVLAVGLAAYGLWRLVQAATGKPKPDEKRSAWVRVGWLATAAIYIALCVRAFALASGSSSGGGGASSNPQPWAAKVLRWPAGPELLGLAGAALVIGGVALAIWGLAHKYEKDLRLERLKAGWRRTVKGLGATGEVTRGFLVVLVGSFLLSAAVTDRPSKAKSVDSALKSLGHHAYGAVLIGVVAAGLLCFALYSFAEAHLREL